jgi:hypothetical protein
MRIQYRVSVKSIFEAGKQIQTITDVVFEIQKSYMEQRYEQIFDRARAGTMVATGELRSKLFNRQRMTGSNHVRFECGYEPTSNNQSVHQEFDIFDPVHHSRKQHLDRQGQPKCSINPVDIHAMFGEQYTSNRSAKRRALASAIEQSLGTRVKFATNRGHTLRYEPDLTTLVSRLSTITRAVTRGV